jgi:hypothetical protein
MDDRSVIAYASEVASELESRPRRRRSRLCRDLEVCELLLRVLLQVVRFLNRLTWNSFSQRPKLGLTQAHRGLAVDEPVQAQGTLRVLPARCAEGRCHF